MSIGLVKTMGCNRALWIVLSLALLITSSASAQYVWDVRIDSANALYVAANGRFCTAAIQDYDSDSDKFSIQLWRSEDGGNKWVLQYSMKDPSAPPPYDGFEPITQIQQIDSSNAIIIGDSSFILRTFDAGKTWTQQYGKVIDGGGLLAVHFSDPMHGI